MTWIVENIDVIWKIIGMLITAAAGIPALAGVKAKAKQLKEQAEAQTKANRMSTCADLVKGIVVSIGKNTIDKARADGTLNADICKQAFDVAMIQAKAKFQEHGVEMAEEVVEVMIEEAVTYWKRQGK